MVNTMLPNWYIMYKVTYLWTCKKVMESGFRLWQLIFCTDTYNLMTWHANYHYIYYAYKTKHIE